MDGYKLPYLTCWEVFVMSEENYTKPATFTYVGGPPLKMIVL